MRACARACVECVSFYFSFCGALSFFISPKASHSVFRGQMEATGSERQKFVAEVPNYGNTESFFSFHYLVSAHEQVTPPTSGVVPSQGDFPLAHQTLEDRSHDPLTFHPQEEVNASLHADCCQEFRRHCRCAAVPQCRRHQNSLMLLASQIHLHSGCAALRQITAPHFLIYTTVYRPIIAILQPNHLQHIHAVALQGFLGCR